MAAANQAALPSKAEIARTIDHTLLDPRADVEGIRKVCREAVEHGFFSVCVNPSYVKLAAQELAGTGIAVCTVVGFPLGATTTATKVHEAAEAVEQGAEEIDMVLNLGAIKSGDLELAQRDIQEVVRAAAPKAVKVILETCYLTDEEKRTACLLAVDAGAAFVKTSTGFGSGGATLHDVRLMRRAVGDQVGVKASGGIRDIETVLAMLDAGATRIGASSSVKIMAQLEERLAEGA